MTAVVALLAGLAQLAAPHRLPTQLKPLHYDLHMLVSHQDCTFLGKVLITLKVYNTSNKLEFHSGVKIQKDSVQFGTSLSHSLLDFDPLRNEGNVFKSRKTEILLFRKGKKKDVVQMNLDRNLEEGGTYQLFMEFNGTMNTRKTSGIYCWPYKVDGKVKRLVSTFFEPDLARKAFPCWDEPGFKATYSIRISHTNTTTAISNMPSYLNTPMKDKPGWVTDWFSRTPIMASYLASWLVSELKGSRTLGELRTWAQDGKDTSQLLSSAQAALSHLQVLLSFKDPLPKQDLVLISNLRSSGLENWGIISFRESKVATENKTKTWSMKAANLVAHELAHSWFGNLVTPSWWNDIWLSEGIVTYLAERTVQDLYPEWDYLKDRLVEQLVKVFYSDSLPSAHPLAIQKVPETIKQVFSTITYQKGALVMWMVENTVGRDAMHGGLSAYLKGRAYSTADEGFLWDCIEGAAPHSALPPGLTLRQLMSNWTGRPGYPVVAVLRNYTQGTLTVHQRSVLRDGTRWWIPLVYTGEGNTQTYKVWMDPAQESLVLKDPVGPDHWLVFNLNASGLYRVEYDKKNRKLLERGWKFVGGLEEVVTERGGWRVGPPGHPAAWPATLTTLSHALTLTKGTPYHRTLTEYVKGLLEGEFTDQGGLYGREDSGHHRQQLASLACYLPLDQCLTQAKAIYHFWVSSHFQLEEDVRQTVLCTVVRHMDDIVWIYVRERLLKEPPDHHRAREDMVKALACSNSNQTITHYVKWALGSSKEPGLDRTEARLALKAVAENHPNLALQMFSTNVTSKSSYKKIKWDKVLETLALQVNSAEQLEQLKVAAENKGVEQSGLAEIAKNNLEWLQKNLQELGSWLMEDKQPVR